MVKGLQDLFLLQNHHQIYTILLIVCLLFRQMVTQEQPLDLQRQITPMLPSKAVTSLASYLVIAKLHPLYMALLILTYMSLILSSSMQLFQDLKMRQHKTQMIPTRVHQVLHHVQIGVTIVQEQHLFLDSMNKQVVNQAYSMLYNLSRSLIPHSNHNQLLEAQLHFCLEDRVT